MKITRTSIFTGIERTLDLPITESQLAEWEAGSTIQSVMPDLTPSQREFVMTGITDEEWDNEYGTEDDDDVHEFKGKLQIRGRGQSLLGRSTSRGCSFFSSIWRFLCKIRKIRI